MQAPALDRVESLILPLLSQHRFDLVETQWLRERGRWVLRLFIDKMQEKSVSGKKEGVTLEDCENVNNWVGALLDQSDLFSISYTLEVSSPGINRRLRKKSDFERFIGKKVKISLWAPLAPESIQKNFSGTLIGCIKDAVEIQDLSSGKISLPLTAIAKAHLDII